MSLWIVNTRGVCAAEFFGAYSTEDKALARVKELHEKSDQYHSFEITEMEVDEDHYPDRWERHLSLLRDGQVVRFPKPYNENVDITYRKENSNGSA